MQIKISSLKSSLHDDTLLQEASKVYIEEIGRRLDTKLVLSPLEDYDCDLKLIFVETGGSEGLFLNNFDKLQGPYYLLTSKGNNSLAASLEILTYLNIHGLKGEVIHGDLDYVSSRIASLAKINHIKKELANTKFGLIGKPSDWLISSVPNANKLKEKFGADIVNISLEEIKDDFNKMSFNEVSIEGEFDKKELSKASKVYLAMKSIVSKYGLSGFSIRCFDLLNTIHTTGCVGLSLLNRDGITATCEGDVMALLSMKIASLVANESTFQANPSRIDVSKREVVFAHCTLPLDMCESYRFDTHFESGTGVAIKGELKKEKVTVLRICSSLDRYFLEEGEIVTNLDDKTLCRTQILVKFKDDISSLLSSPCGNHHIIFYGEHKKEIKELLDSIM